MSCIIDVQSRIELASQFATGETPCQEDFEALIDAFVHQVEDGVTICKSDADTVFQFLIRTQSSDGENSLIDINGEDETVLIGAGLRSAYSGDDTGESGAYTYEDEGTLIYLDNSNNGIYLKAGNVRVRNNMEVQGNLTVRGTMTVRNEEVINDVTLGDEKQEKITIKGTLTSGEEKETIDSDSPLLIQGGTQREKAGELILHDQDNDTYKMIQIDNERLFIGSAFKSTGDDVDFIPQLRMDKNGAVYLSENMPVAPANNSNRLYVDGNVRVQGNIRLFGPGGTVNPRGTLHGVNETDLFDLTKSDYVPTSKVVRLALDTKADLNGSKLENFNANMLCLDSGDQSGIIQVPTRLRIDSAKEYSHLLMSYGPADDKNYRCFKAGEDGNLYLGNEYLETGGWTSEKNVVFGTSGQLGVGLTDLNNMDYGLSLFVEGDAYVNGRLCADEFCIDGKVIDFDNLGTGGGGANPLPVEGVFTLTDSGWSEVSEGDLFDIRSIGNFRIQFAEEVDPNTFQRFGAFVFEFAVSDPTNSLIAGEEFAAFIEPDLNPIGDSRIMLKASVDLVNPKEIVFSLSEPILEALDSSISGTHQFHLKLFGRHFQGAAYDDFEFTMRVQPVMRFVGSLGSRGSGTDEFLMPTDIAITPPDGSASETMLYAVDFARKRVVGIPTQSTRRIDKDLDGGYLTSVDETALTGDSLKGRGYDAEAELLSIDDDSKSPRDNGYFVQVGTSFDTPNSNVHTPGLRRLVYNAGQLYMSDQNSASIWKTDELGNYIAFYGERGSSIGQLNSIQHIGVDESGNMYAFDQADANIKQFDPHGGFIRQWGLSTQTSDLYNVQLEVAGEDIVISSRSLAGESIIDIYKSDGSLSDSINMGVTGVVTLSSNEEAVYVMTQKRLAYIEAGKLNFIYQSESETPFSNVKSYSITDVNDTGYFALWDGTIASTSFTSSTQKSSELLDEGGKLSFEAGGLTFEAYPFKEDNVTDVSDIHIAKDGRLYLIGRVAGEGDEGLLVYDQGNRVKEALSNPLEGNELIVQPYAVTVDYAGRVYIVDYINQQVKIFDENHLPVGVFGGRGGDPGKFERISDLCATRTKGIFVADEYNRTVTQFSMNDATGEIQVENIWYGTLASTPFERPAGIAYDPIKKQVLVYDSNLKAVHQLDLDSGTFVNMVPIDVPVAYQLHRYSLTVDENGLVYFFNPASQSVDIYNLDEGKMVHNFGGPGTLYGKFVSNEGGLTSRGNVIFVTDTFKGNIQMFTNENLLAEPPIISLPSSSSSTRPSSSSTRPSSSSAPVSSSSSFIPVSSSSKGDDTPPRSSSSSRGGGLDTASSTVGLPGDDDILIPSSSFSSVGGGSGFDPGDLMSSSAVFDPGDINFSSSSLVGDNGSVGNGDFDFSSSSFFTGGGLINNDLDLSGDELVGGGTQFEPRMDLDGGLINPAGDDGASANLEGFKRAGAIDDEAAPIEGGKDIQEDANISGIIEGLREAATEEETKPETGGKDLQAGLNLNPEVNLAAGATGIGGLQEDLKPLSSSLPSSSSSSKSSRRRRKSSSSSTKAAAGARKPSSSSSKKSSSSSKKATAPKSSAAGVKPSAQDTGGLTAGGLNTGALNIDPTALKPMGKSSSSSRSKGSTFKKP